VTSLPPPAPPGAGRDHILAFEPRGWGRRRTEDLLRITPDGATFVHEEIFRKPLRLPLGMLHLGLVERGSARPGAGTGRFPVLRRLSATAVIPREEGVEGWLWTTAGGSALTTLGDPDDAPNAAVLFTKPLGPEQLEPCLQPDALAAIVARSALGVPAVPGFLFRVAEPAKAESAFRSYNLLRPLSDREVPPTLRRSLPTDRPADPTLRLEDRGPARSVAPPGF
jgi:hypothetical protein